MDVSHGPRFDLTVRKFQEEILHLIATEQIAFVRLGTPCSSWSRARRWDGRGPGPLTDHRLFLMDYPNLSPKDQLKVKVGNNLTRFSAKVFRCCLQHQVPVALENPHASRLWLASPIKHFLIPCSGYTDFGMDGKPYRKRTRVMWANVVLSGCRRQCCTSKGLCSRTGIRNQQLQASQGGQFLTLWAQPYPHLLCRRLATAFHAAVLQHASDPLWQKLQSLWPDTNLRFVLWLAIFDFGRQCKTRCLKFQTSRARGNRWRLVCDKGAAQSIETTLSINCAIVCVVSPSATRMG